MRKVMMMPLSVVMKSVLENGDYYWELLSRKRTDNPLIIPGFMSFSFSSIITRVDMLGIN